MFNCLSSMARPLSAACVVLVSLLGLALPVHAQRGITSSNTGNDNRNPVASANLNVCGNDDLTGSADACAGFFNFGIDNMAINALVAGYEQSRPGTAWGNVTQTYNADGALFNLSGAGIFGLINFQQSITGSFVIALTGDWAPQVQALRQNWSVYFLYDNVLAEGGEHINFAFFGEDAPDDPNTPKREVFTMRDLQVRSATIYQYMPTASGSVPEPSSLGLSGLALAALVGSGAWLRRRRSALQTR